MGFLTLQPRSARVFAFRKRPSCVTSKSLPFAQGMNEPAESANKKRRITRSGARTIEGSCSNWKWTVFCHVVYDQHRSSSFTLFFGSWLDGTYGFHINSRRTFLRSVSPKFSDLWKRFGVSAVSVCVVLWLRVFICRWFLTVKFCLDCRRLFENN